MKPIKQSVINTFNRVGIDYKPIENLTNKVSVSNWITGETCQTTPLVATCVEWVYRTALAYEQGTSKVNVSDFDRVRHFILAQDNNVYSKCID